MIYFDNAAFRTGGDIARKAEKKNLISMDSFNKWRDYV